MPALPALFEDNLFIIPDFHTILVSSATSQEWFIILWDVSHALGRDEDDDDDQVRQEESLQDNDSMYSNVQDEQNKASNSAYENLEIQSEQSTQPEHAGKNSTAEKNDGKNNYYDPVALKPQPSRPAPSRPLPYTVTRKLSGKSGSEVDHKSLEKVQYCHV